ncbi:MAG TPA: orotidine-5'-phosphate decarboxylase [Thermoanaerobaculia bacterium]|jgi:orotidine-5'-phosphate decarboxylase|nr:orotidine-5'-phosphate decarboxylase [Thermoanaerobaculia bacterium]
MQAVDRLVVALDLSVRDDILRAVDDLHGAAGTFKIGLQAFIANGPAIVREIVARGDRVFLDLKIHDIPNTAKNAVAEAVFLGATIVTVHAAGGDAMLRACADSQRNALVLGVTILTSLDESDLPRIGFSGDVQSNAVRLAQLVQSAGLRGVVASPREIAALREACGRDLTILTPGIRPAGGDAGDQRRTMTAAEAIRAGADYIVVGRPITAARDKRAAAMQIVDEIASAS